MHKTLCLQGGKFWFVDILTGSPNDREQPSNATSAGWYADVAVDEPVTGCFTYSVPERFRPKLRVGSIVEVPFGSRLARGCVLYLKKEHGLLETKRIKPIRHHLTPDFYLTDSAIELAKWISEYYLAPLGATLACVSFIGFNDVAPKTQRYVRLSADNGSQKLTPTQSKVVSWVSKQSGPVPIPTIIEATGVSHAVISRLLKKGVFEEVFQHVARPDDYGATPEAESPFPLTPFQQTAVTEVVKAFGSEIPPTFLLHGVTGSGKTEVYLRAIEHALELNGSAIVLVPEISLTPQAVERFRRRFGELVGVYHSRLTIGQKYDLWLRIRDNSCRILIGARSAVFAPLHNLKIIVVDEEHEPSYKQDTTPRYHARDVAILRGHREGAVVLLGSATPSIETYYKAKSGKFHLLTLPERIDARPLPPITIIDLGQVVREELELSILCPEALSAIHTTLDAHQQVLVFLNRRGYFNFALCLECKNTLRCQNCDIALTYHKVGDRLTCHYCGFSLKRPTSCPLCGNTELTMVGLGTQRIEEELEKHFPGRGILRIDLDTMRRRTAHIEAWQAISQRKADIIVGTQMIARGIHLEGIGLVVVPLADISLYQPDFRAAERAFALLTQVAGRAGRGESQGQVIIQTYVPHHYAIRCAQTHDYAAFFTQECHIRRILRFPPFSRLIAFLGQAEDFESGQELFRCFTEDLKNLAYPHREKVSVLGPTPAPVPRIAGRFRWRALMRGEDVKLMHTLAEQALQRFRRQKGHSKLELTLDVDPYDLL